MNCFWCERNCGHVITWQYVFHNLHGEKEKVLAPTSHLDIVANTIQLVTYIHFVYISDFEICINPFPNALSPWYRFLTLPFQILFFLQTSTVLNLAILSSHNETPSCYLTHTCYPAHRCLNPPTLHPPNSSSTSNTPQSFTRSCTHPHRPWLGRSHNRNAPNPPKPRSLTLQVPHVGSELRR